MSGLALRSVDLDRRDHESTAAKSRYAPGRYGATLEVGLEFTELASELFLCSVKADLTKRICSYMSKLERSTDALSAIEGCAGLENLRFRMSSHANILYMVSA